MKEDVKKFYEQMSKDKNLQEESAKILNDIEAKNLPEKERNDAYDKSILELAKKNGFDFTLEDALAFNKTITEKFSELSEDDLEQVAGGISMDMSALKLTMVAYGVFPDLTKLPGSITSLFGK